jgi:Flp pilus assembly CpaE family ATPase
MVRPAAVDKSFEERHLSTEPIPSPGRALLISPSNTLRQAVATALTEVGIHEVVEVREYPYLSELDSLVSACGICFLDASSDTSIALRILARMAGTSISVIILHSSPDADLIVHCLRRGAADVLRFPADIGQLQSMLDRAAARKYFNSNPVRPVGAMYGVMAGKGGCGSTTTATHMALCLAEARPRKTLLVDMDGIGGTVAFLLQQKPKFSVRDVFADAARMDEDLWRTMVVKIGSLDVLLAPAEPVLLEIPETRLLGIIDFWRSVYDCLILDLPSCYSEISAAVARLADLLLLIATCELTAIHSTMRTISHLEQNSVRPKSIKVVLNRHRPGGLWSDTLDARLGDRVLGNIGEAEAVLKGSVLDGTPVQSRSRYAADIAGIVRQVTGWPIALPQKGTPKTSGGRLFSKLGARLTSTPSHAYLDAPAVPTR